MVHNLDLKVSSVKKVSVIFLQSLQFKYGTQFGPKTIADISDIFGVPKIKMCEVLEPVEHSTRGKKAVEGPVQKSSRSRKWNCR